MADSLHEAARARGPAEDQPARGAQILRRQAGARRRRPRHRGRRIAGHHGRLGHRQKRAAQAHDRPAPARRRPGDRRRGRPRHARPRELTEFRRRFGMSFQEGALFDSMNVAQNIAFPLSRAGRARAAARSRTGSRNACAWSASKASAAEAAFRAVGRHAAAGRLRPGDRGLARDPAFRRADQRPRPGAHRGDRPADHRVCARSCTRTTVTITHDLRSAFRIADRVAMLHQGKVIAIDDGRGLPALGRSAGAPVPRRRGRRAAHRQGRRARRPSARRPPPTRRRSPPAAPPASPAAGPDSSLERRMRHLRELIARSAGGRRGGRSAPS